MRTDKCGTTRRARIIYDTVVLKGLIKSTAVLAVQGSSAGSWESLYTVKCDQLDTLYSLRYSYILHTDTPHTAQLYITQLRLRAAGTAVGGTSSCCSIQYATASGIYNRGRV